MVLIFQPHFITECERATMNHCFILIFTVFMANCHSYRPSRNVFFPCSFKGQVNNDYELTENFRIHTFPFLSLTICVTVEGACLDVVRQATKTQSSIQAVSGVTMWGIVVKTTSANISGSILSPPSSLTMMAVTSVSTPVSSMFWIWLL